MNDTLYLDADRYFHEHLRFGMEALLAPIDPDAPCGRPLRELPGYRAIAEERRHDDASLPMGTWQHDLKRADWHKVGRLAVEMLVHQSKDLQLLVWLFESQIKRHGLAGIAPTLTLAREMCTRYWDGIFPRSIHGDHEHRANLLRSIAVKHLAAVRLAPLILDRSERGLCWADWERAHHHAQLRTQQDSREGPALDELQAALADTPSDALAAVDHDLAAGLAAIASLGAAIDPLFAGEEAPSLGKLAELLDQMRSLFAGELHKRGIAPASVEPAGAGTLEAASKADGDATAAACGENPEAPSAALAPDALRDREDAYARLAEIAAFLMRIEPHSPAPYLVRTATEWGRLSTPELYREVFLRLGGQLNIFEMLGIEAPNAGNAA